MSRNWDWAITDISSSKDLLPLKGNRIIIRYICKRCGKSVEAKFRKELYWRQKRLFCRRCNSITTCNEIYGTNNPNQSEVVKAKIRKTSVEKYGVPYPMQNKEISERLKRSLANMSPEKKVEASAKKRQWWKNLSKDELNKILELRKKVWKKNLGVDFPTQSKKVIELQQKNKLERWGDPHYNNINKNKQTKKERYGDENYNNRNKFLNTMVDRYGTNHVTYKYNYYGIMFDSKPELAVWIYCIDHDISIIREPIVFEFDYDGDTTHYTPDFLIDGQLIEIKGSQFVDKETGKWVCIFDRSLDGLYEAKRQCALFNGVKILYNDDYLKYLNYVSSMYTEDYLSKFEIFNPRNPSYFGLNGFYQVQKPFNSIPIYYSQPIVPNKGISPYDINKDSEYTINKDSKGISPFYINKERVT